MNRKKIKQEIKIKTNYLLTNLNKMIMKKVYLILAAAVGITITSCTTNDYLGDVNNDQAINDGSIQFGLKMQNMTRAGELVGATAAEKLGGMFVVEGTKGTEAADAPSSDVVFDNYLVGYTANTAGTTASNTHNWEYVGKQTGIDGRMTAATWTALHNGTGEAKTQSIKYWDYSQPQYDFIAWSTGNLEAVTDAAVAGSKVKVTRINTGSTLSSDGFTLTAASADDLLKCYYTDITTVKKGNDYGKPVTLTFKNMAAKVRVALYETVPGYSVKNVYFYTSDAAPTSPADLGGPSTNAESGTDEEKAAAKSATLFTTSSTLPKSGEVLVYYPHIGTGNNTKEDYNKANVTVSNGTTGTTQTFDALTAQYGAAEANEAPGNIYLGRDITKATFAGDKAKDFYTAVVPNQNGQPLTLRVDYTLVATDGSGEEIKVYGAKAIVPATYTKWQPNYAYTYIFKISDNTNGWTSKTNADPKGLFPITFDAMVANFTDFNAEQTTVTTVATPSITTYQQGHDHANKDEYYNNQKAGKDLSNVKDLYVQVMSTGATPALEGLTAANSLLFSVTKTGTTPISEASVMDALQNHTEGYAYNAASPVGRNGITLTKNANIAISNTTDFTTIINGVDDNPISVGAGEAAKIDIDLLGAGTYAFVYVQEPATEDEKIYQVATITGDTPEAKNLDAKNYYEIALTGSETPLASGTATAGKVYFVKNVDAKKAFVSYTFKQTKVGEDVTGLVEATIGDKASTYTAGHFYFDVYNQNDGKYAVKVIKVVAAP